MMRSFLRGCFALRPLACVAALSVLPVCLASGEWPQWGGPNRDFRSVSTGLSAKWPDAGPKSLWKRELGDGYSSIIVDGERLFTMYRKGENQDVIVALSAKDGSTLWEFAYDAPFDGRGLDMQFGPGPHATPLIVGDRLFAVGATAIFHCLDARTGKPIWSHDLFKEYNDTPLGRGFSCSPIAYQENVILTVGGEEHGVMAFKQSDGSVAWSKHTFENSHSSPILVKFGGEDQLVIFNTTELAAVNPANGEWLWSHPHTTKFGANISTPVWAGDDMIFCSCAYQPGGARLVKLVRESGKTVAKELWYQAKMRSHHASMVYDGKLLIGSSGDFGPAFLIALDVATGKPLWRERGFKKANVLAADGKLIILDEDGVLALASATPEALTVHSKFQLCDGRAWTTPTLVGKTLFVRDRTSIMALDLS